MKNRFHLLQKLLPVAVLVLAVAPTGAMAQVPTEPAPAPTTHPADAISVFSGAYSNVSVAEFSTGWDDADVFFVPVAGDQVLSYSIYGGGGFAAIQMNYPGFDAGSMTTFHMDVWTDAVPANGFTVKLVDFGPNAAYGDGSPYPAIWPFDDQEAIVPVDLTPGAWTSVEIPLSDFVFAGSGQPMTLSSISQILFDGAGMNVSIDNIYFSRPLAPGNDIYMLDTQSGDVQRVTYLDAVESGTAHEYNAAASPDGKTVVHDVVTYWPYPYSHRLYITDIQSGVSTPLENGEGGNDARFSPNGRYLVFDKAAYGDNRLYLAEVKGPNAGSVTVLRENATSADWSPDSRRVVFRDATDGSIRTMAVDGGTETVLAGAGEHPVWSPNGQAVAFERFNDIVPGRGIYRVDVKKDGTAKGLPIRITPEVPDQYLGSATWSNNSRLVAFQGNAGNGDWDANLWTVPAHGGTPSVLFGSPDNGELDPAYSNNGRYVFFSALTVPGVASKGIANVQFDETAEADVLPESFVLEQNYPNPFNPTTSIRFELPSDGDVRLTIFDAMGREVTRLVDRSMSAGTHTINWSAAGDMPSGAYFYRLTAGGFTQTRPMTLIK